MVALMVAWKDNWMAALKAAYWGDGWAGLKDGRWIEWMVLCLDEKGVERWGCI